MSTIDLLDEPASPRGLGRRISTRSPRVQIPLDWQCLSVYHLYGNFGEKCPLNGIGIIFGTENRKGIELYHLQNTGKFFIFSRHW